MEEGMTIHVPPHLTHLLKEQYFHLREAGLVKTTSLEAELLFALVDLHYTWTDKLLGTPPAQPTQNILLPLRSM